ncbi:ABC transporter ATP-binding protein [candidate division KSB1 bacterium]|nr:ABC transporter ATP-binding protein [candidate division KSB1 bacterium]
MSNNTSDPNSEKNILIQLSNLKKNFGNLTAVDGLSLEIYKGKILGFLGPNGAGKTTTINMICGLSKPTSGEIIYSDNKFKNIKNHLGICPQENIFWPKLTCIEQLVFMGEMYGMKGKFAKNRSKELLELMGLSEKSKVLASKLSGGMKRRLNICLALIHDPEILILDEPEAGLDPQSRILVRNFIKSLAKEKTIILTTHNMDEADRLADRVAIIDYGKLLLLDTPESLKKSIGEGDILEVELEINHTEKVENVIEILSVICDKVSVSGNSLIIKSKNLIELVSEITEKIKGQGYSIKEIKMRENTLEDVFIHLTGRKLRE